MLIKSSREVVNITPAVSCCFLFFQFVINEMEKLTEMFWFIKNNTGIITLVLHSGHKMN